MLSIYNETVWVIMSKDRKVIACGVPRNRELKFADQIGNTRILTYSSKKKAESGFNKNWFYNSTGYKREDLEAVECNLSLCEIKCQ